jgi:hypothetical protein
MAHDVFISYSSRDKVTADAVCALLEARGIRCWIAPRDILPGWSWAESIIEAIEASKVMVLIFSAHANASVQIHREVERAVNKGLTVVPLRIEDTVPSKTMEYFISTPHWLDALKPPLDQHIERLAAGVLALLKRSGGGSRGVAEVAPPGAPMATPDRVPRAPAEPLDSGAMKAEPDELVFDSPPGTPAASGAEPSAGSTAARAGAERAARGPALPSLARYELERLLGRGRFGSEVYAGTHKAMGNPVAVRVLRRTGHAGWDIARERFLREARILQIAHPSILQVRDVGEEGDLVYLVTDLLQVTSLRQLLTQAGPLPWERLSALARQLLSAAGAIHKRGGLVAGLTPEIILVTTDEDPERLLVSTGGVTQLGDVMALLSEDALRGSAAPNSEMYYLAPELLVGQAPDVRSDVFALAAIVYEAATGHRPFEAATFPTLLGAMLKGRPADPREWQPGLPEQAAAAIMQALASEPTARPATAADLITALFQRSA